MALTVIGRYPTKNENASDQTDMPPVEQAMRVTHDTKAWTRYICSERTIMLGSLIGSIEVNRNPGRGLRGWVFVLSLG